MPSKSWLMRLPNRLRTFLGRPDALRWTVVLAVVLCLPSLATGWILDDRLHHTVVNSWESFPALIRAPHDLYAFILDDPDWQWWVRERGTLPWYASEGVHASFWRPLTSWTVYWDHAAPWSSPVLAHVHSLIWYAVCVLVVGWLFRKILGPGWVAALATLVFAVDEAHAMPVAWIANRSSLLVMVFGAGALLAHIRWRRTSNPLVGLAAPALLTLALLSGEMGLCFAAYFLAFAVFLDQGTLRGRLLSLVPTAAVCAAWRVVYVVNGYGVGGSGLYVDAANDPVRFGAAAIERIPVLLLAQLTPIPSYLGLALEESEAIAFVVVAAAIVVALLALAWRCLRRDPRAWFFATGMLLSVIPMASTLPHDRLLMPVGLGGAGLVALLLASVHVRAASGNVPRPARLLAVVWFVSHVIIAPLLLPVDTLAGRALGAVFETAPNSLRGMDLDNRTLVFVTGPDFFLTSWAPVFLHDEGRATPSRVRVLGAGTGKVVVRRLDAETLELECSTGFLNMPLDRTVWSPDHAFRVGQVFELSDMSIRVGRVTDDGRPDTIRCRFDQPLESLDHVWVYWTADGYKRFVLPAVGQGMTIEAVSLGDIIALALRGAGG